MRSHVRQSPSEPNYGRTDVPQVRQANRFRGRTWRRLDVGGAAKWLSCISARWKADASGTAVEDLEAAYVRAARLGLVAHTR